MKIRLLIIFFGLFVGVSASTFYFLMNHIDTPSIEHGRKLTSNKTIDVTGLESHTNLSLDNGFLQNKWTMLTFGFTSCPDICPTAMAAFRDELNLLSENQDRVQFVFVTVDPERDSKAKLKEYLGYFHKDIIGLTGSPESLARFAKLFGVYFEKQAQGESYTMNHSQQFFLIDPQGKLAAMYTPPLARGKIAVDMTRVIDRVTL